MAKENNNMKSKVIWKIVKMTMKIYVWHVIMWRNNNNNNNNENNNSNNSNSSSNNNENNV
jgi:hypothetical protein